jgi:hypothetical protein
MKYLKIFEKIDLNLDILKNYVEIFRKEQEEYYEWEEYKKCFKNTCQDITKDLEKYLKDLGYDADRVPGYYTNADDDFQPDMDDWDEYEIERFYRQYKKNYESSNGLKFKHWWVEIGKYIIDVTEDQFHPSEEDEYRVSIYKRPNKNYKKL